MKAFKSVVLAAIFAAFSIPVAALAAGDSEMKGVMQHGGEIGAVDHGPTKGTKTKPEVRKELDAAHKAGTHQMGGEVTVAPPAKTGAKKTRSQVNAELKAAHEAGTHEMGGEIPNKSK